MAHGTHNDAHSERSKSTVSFQSSFWLVVILVGLFIAALNFINVMGHHEGGEGHHEATEQHEGGHEATKHEEGHGTEAAAGHEAAKEEATHEAAAGEKHEAEAHEAAPAEHK